MKYEVSQEGDEMQSVEGEPARRAKLPPGMQLENLRDFATRHPVPVNPDQELVGGHGSGMAQTFAAQVCLRVSSK